ncbi:molybdopterin molybdotransferase MoeA [Persephonella sp.]
MIKFDEALKVILENTKRIGKEKVFLNDSLGRILAEDIFADRDNPPADNSGMDGFAVKFEDIKGASENEPAVLEIVAESKAGGELVEVKNGTAAYIYTGGLIPKGADTVVQKELTEVKEGKVYIFKELEKGSNIRPKGGDYKKGDKLISSGVKITPAEMGILSAVNKPTVYVYRRPVVGILTTGDEILDLGEEVKKLSQIRTSNTYSLYGQIIKMGGIPVIVGFAKDDVNDLREKLNYAKHCDILLTTGGISVGEYDLVKDFVMEVLGVNILFWKVAQKPGKPVAFGVWGEENEKLFFGIPGNPVAAMTVVETMVKPALRKMSGDSKLFDPIVRAVLVGGYKRKKSERLEFIKVALKFEDNKFYAVPYRKQGSNILTSMLSSHGFGLIDIGVNEVKDGELIDVIVYDTDFMRS